MLDQQNWPQEPIGRTKTSIAAKCNNSPDRLRHPIGQDTAYLHYPHLNKCNLLLRSLVER